MHKTDCIFCKVVKGEIPSYKIYEDDKFLAFLDLFPNTEGMTLVITKDHYDSYAFDMPDEVYSELMLKAKEIGKHIDSRLGTQRTALVIEGMGVNHIHVKLYPLHGLDKKFESMDAPEKKFFDRYQGYLTTLMGPKADYESLKAVQEKLKI